MLVRLLGKEGEVSKGSYTHPFTDVPSWANNYVGYLYEKNITSGISGTQYGSSQYVTYLQYTTFVLKALGYTNDDFKWDESDVKAAEIGLYTSAESSNLKLNEFRRDHMVHVSYQGLDCKVKGSSDRLIDKLIDDGSVTPSDKDLSILN